MGQLLGGIAVLLGAGFAYLQFQEQQKNFSAQQETCNSGACRSNPNSSEAAFLLISNISKGFEQLGSDKVEQRLGGIYLGKRDERLEGYHQPILEALGEFVRDHTGQNR